MTSFEQDDRQLLYAPYMDDILLERIDEVLDGKCD